MEDELFSLTLICYILNQWLSRFKWFCSDTAARPTFALVTKIAVSSASYCKWSMQVVLLKFKNVCNVNVYYYDCNDNFILVVINWTI